MYNSSSLVLIVNFVEEKKGVVKRAIHCTSFRCVNIPVKYRKFRNL